MKRTCLSLVLVLTSAAAAATQSSSVAALQEMADTERAFARAATVKGWRAAFIEFFAPDAVTFTPEPGPALPGLRSRPVRPFSEEELSWEPRTGDVAASGDLGWLTGPSTFIDHTAKPPTTGYGNYLSIWKRQTNGTWRVFIDVGTNTKAAVPFPPGFHRMPVASHYSGSETQDASKATLLTADRRLNERVAAVRAPQAYGESLNGAEARLHRAGSGSAPAVGKNAIVAWLAEHQAAMAATTGSGEASKAGDLGYTYGKYELTGAAPQTGAYVRVWTRDSAGRWLLEADVVAPSRR